MGPIEAASSEADVLGAGIGVYEAPTINVLTDLLSLA